MADAGRFASSATTIRCRGAYQHSDVATTSPWFAHGHLRGGGAIVEGHCTDRDGGARTPDLPQTDRPGGRASRRLAIGRRTGGPELDRTAPVEDPRRIAVPRFVALAEIGAEIVTGSDQRFTSPSARNCAAKRLPSRPIATCVGALIVVAEFGNSSFETKSGWPRTMSAGSPLLLFAASTKPRTR